MLCWIIYGDGYWDIIIYNEWNGAGLPPATSATNKPTLNGIEWDGYYDFNENRGCWIHPTTSTSNTTPAWNEWSVCL